MTVEQLLQAIEDAGFTPETFTDFLHAGRLAIELASIGAAVRNEQAAQTAGVQASEARLQALSAAAVAKQAEIDALGS